MADYVPAPGVAKVDVVWQDDAQTVQNSFHVHNGGSSPWSQANLEALLDCFYANWVTDIKPLLPTAISLIQLIATDLTSLAGLKIYRPISPAEPGTGASPALPNSVTKAIRLDTGSRGRGENGRIFVPALMEGDVTLNTLAGPVLTAWQTALEDTRLAIPGAIAGAVLCVLSRWDNKVKRTTAFPRPVIGINTANPYVDVQKDRLPYHKKHKKTRTPTP